MPEQEELSTNVNDSSAVRYELGTEQGIGDEESILNLDISDTDFIKYFTKFKKDFDSFYGSKAYNLEARVKENFTYRFSRQLQNVKLKSYSARFVDPIIYDAEAYLKPIALSRLPEITVRPANDENPQSQQNAD